MMLKNQCAMLIAIILIFFACVALLKPDPVIRVWCEVFEGNGTWGRGQKPEYVSEASKLLQNIAVDGDINKDINRDK